MNIDQPTIRYINSAVQVAKLVGMECVIIEPGRVRGMNEDSQIFFLHTDDVPTLPCGTVGITRLGPLVDRLSLIEKVGGEVNVTAVTETASLGQFVRSLTFKSGRTKVEYRCSNPSTIRAIKGINDPFDVDAELAPSAVMMMTQAAAAMQSENVRMHVSESGVMFSCSDINSDSFETEFGQTVMWGATAKENVFEYPIKPLLAVLKHAPTSRVSFSTRGFLRATVKGFTIGIKPVIKSL